jgi:predicted AAA+ superfamily ATPase
MHYPITIMTNNKDNTPFATVPNSFFEKVEQCLAKVDRLLPDLPEKIDFSNHIAARWQTINYGAYFWPIDTIEPTKLEDILCADSVKQKLISNTQTFTNGKRGNNALLWGPRGTGKSSLIRALLNHFAPQGLRMIEVDKSNLIDLPMITSQLSALPYRFVIFCDDLSFETEDGSYKALKAILDGSLSAPPDNILIYASSNRRHLLPEFMSDNRDTKIVEKNGEWELHHNEAVEEKISLSERFGLWLSFQPFNQTEYLEIVAHWLNKLGNLSKLDEKTRLLALEWSLTRGSRSGRVAKQFVIDLLSNKE